MIVALSGWKSSGKDAIANYLVKHYGAMRIAFADPLKDTVSAQFLVPRDHLDLPAQKELPILTMPVVPADAFSKMIAEFMFKEFRSASGLIPQDFGYEDSKFVGVIGRENFPLYWTPRALCILEGSSKRSADSNFWVKQAVSQVKKDGLYVISDLRYTSEVNALHSALPGQVLVARIDRYDSSPSSDPSERDLDTFPFPYTINNRGTINQLFDQVDDLMISKGFRAKNQA
jgi:hypothetical protein